MDAPEARRLLLSTARAAAMMRCDWWEWERFAPMEAMHTLPERELDAIVALVWGAKRRENQLPH